MNLSAIHSIYFLGIGGIGMSALALYCLENGYQVLGYDKTPSPVSDALISKGIELVFDESQFPSQLPDLVVYTPAIPASNTLAKYFKEHEIPFVKRAAFLGELSKNKKALCVAGTHGKTSTSAMLAHILNVAHGGINAFVGGVLSNYNTNYLGDSSSEWMVAEADEFDRSFLQLNPFAACVTSTDADHLDIYESAEVFEEGFHAFMNLVKGKIFVCDSVRVRPDKEQKCVSYGLKANSDARISQLRFEGHRQQFWIEYDQQKTQVSIALPGEHNALNACAAMLLALEAGVDFQKSADALSTFKGVKRRFEFIAESDQAVYIDDYAHHPTELEAAIAAARSLFPNKYITGIFQPHLFSRTRDFEHGFATALAKLDELILLDIYPAREEPIDGVSSANLLKRIELENKQLLSKEACIEYCKIKKPKVLLTLGAGDIDRLVEPLKKIYV